jgi:microtubule-associated serine/threonine kinase
MSHQTIQKQQSHPLSQNTTSMSSLILQQQQQQQQQQQLSHRKSFHGSQNAAHSKLSSYPSSSTPPLNSSNDSSNEGSFHGERQQRSLVFRPRSRSLSSPSRSPVTDNNVSSMNALFKERFPKAQVQMDERLTSFINEYNNVNTSSNRDSQPIVRFVTNQILGIARDCLHKSHSKQILTSRYFCDMSENLQRLLIETNEKSPEAAGEIARIIKKLILIISRPARLLECLEFDPEEFYKLLEAAEDQAKINHITNDLPIYIITKLGLNRDPLSDMNQTNSCLDEKDKQSTNSSTCSSKITDDKCDTSDTSLKDARKCEENPNSSIVSISSDTSCLTSTPIKSSQTAELSTSATTDKMSTGPTENDYEFIKLISNGAYGSVHLVKHRVSCLII